MRIAFDIGGVLTKYPSQFKVLIGYLNWAAYYMKEIVENKHYPEIFIISDMHPKEKMIKMLAMNEIGHGLKYEIPLENILCADYEKYGENCKIELCKQYKIGMIFDDHMGYLANYEPSDGNNSIVRLFVMPKPDKDYYHHEWRTDGSEGNFGRRTQTKTTEITKEDKKNGIYCEHAKRGENGKCKFCSSVTSW